VSKAGWVGDGEEEEEDHQAPSEEDPEGLLLSALQPAVGDRRERHDLQR
jgi:hypothetical protein